MIVERQPAYMSKGFNRPYRGIYRGVPLGPDEHGEYLDPSLFGDDLDTIGILPSLAEAKELFELFAERRPRDSMEIIFVRSSEDAWSSPVRDSRLQFFGIDVAGDAPFYSIVADMPSDARIADLEKLLNEHGLFSSSKDALEYNRRYFEAGLDNGDADPPLRLWEVYGTKA